MYKYDTHLHTADVSLCATASGKYQALAYRKAGYDGIMITNHFFRGSTCGVPKALPWEERVNLFCKGYEDAKKTGEEIGLKVFFGWEETYEDQDFLVYGLDKEWLLKHPEVEHWTIEDQFKEVSKYGGIVIHAHPFRNRSYISKIRLYPHLIHGVEVFNGDNTDAENQNAFVFAKQYDLPMTAGSDSHHLDIICSGIYTEKPIESIDDYIHMILARESFKIIYP